MDDKCKDCPYIKGVEDDVTRLRNDIRDIYGRLGDVEVTVGKKEEQINNIFDILEEIKNSIKSINVALNSLGRKPLDNAEKFKWIVITAITSSSMTALIAFLISKTK